jgi:hypothetical protein
VFNPSLHSLLVQARVDALQRAARSYYHGREVNRPSAASLSTVVKRAINRVFAGGPAARDELAPLRGLELVGDGSVARLHLRS